MQSGLIVLMTLIGRLLLCASLVSESSGLKCLRLARIGRAVAYDMIEAL